MKLLALHCPQCESPLIPDNDHVVTVCDRCQTTVHIGDEGLAQILVHYVASAIGANVTRWLPFWVFEGQVHILQRQTQGGNSERQSRQLWHRPRTLYVPAWELSLATAQSIGGSLIQQQPVYQTSPQPAVIRLTPVTVTAGDAVKLLEFMVLAIEARRSDWLKNLDFRLEVDEPELWALPADDSGLVAFEG
jgi:hypothetical protein